MNKFNISQLFFLLGVIVLSSSCKKDSNSQSQDNEMNLLQSYLNTNDITVSPTASGLYVIPKESGSGATPQTGDFVLLNYSASWLSSGKLFDTNDTTQARKNSIPIFQPIGGPFKFLVGSTIWGPGMSEGLHNLKEGDSAKFIIPSSLWDNDFSTRIYDLRLLKVYKNPFTFEQEQISYFLDSISSILQKSPKLTLADSTKNGTTGVYYIETLKGAGDSIKDGQQVTVAYSGVLLPYRGLSKERAFDASTSLAVSVNSTGSTIPGFIEGLRHMRKGGKAIVVIPYYRGYGAAIQYYYNQIIIPAYSTLVFYLEVKDVI